MTDILAAVKYFKRHTINTKIKWLGKFCIWVQNIEKPKNFICYCWKLSEELKQRFSEIRKGEKNSFYGKTHTEESKEKIRMANKGKRYNSMEFMKLLHKKANKKVYSQIDNIVFDSLTSCANHYKMSPSSISNMIANRINNKYKLTFEIPNPIGVHTFSGCEDLYLERFCDFNPESEYCKIS